LQLGGSDLLSPGASIKLRLVVGQALATHPDVVTLDPHAIIVGVVVLVMSVGVMMVTDNRCSIGKTFDGCDYRIKTELIEDRDLRRPLHRESTCSVWPVAMFAVEVEVGVMKGQTGQ
jgi:hypothetical protein